jgi:hypothetical protein
MSSVKKCSGLASLLLLGWLSVVGSAQAQYGVPGLGTPGIYAGGAVNPYGAMGAGYGAGGASPSGGSGGMGSSPYTIYSGSGNGGIYGTAGGALYGAAQVINAYGHALTAQEQSRIMREQYYQAKIDTQRRKFDLQMYIRLNTPTFADQQIALSKQTLRRIQNSSPSGEIASGHALNILLDDAAKFGGRKANLGASDLPPEVLKQLNLSSRRGHGIGVLRNDGKISWPLALIDLLPAEQRKNMSTQAQMLIRDAAKGKHDANVFKDLRSDLDKAREQLLKKVNDMPGAQYMEAKRFINDLEGSLRAVQDGEVMVQAQFDNWIGGKTQSVQDVVDYLVRNGLRFAPATAADDAAYRALYYALVNYDIALNSQYPAESRDTKE